MESRGLRIVGWVLTVLIALFLLGPSAGGKFAEWEGKKEMFDKIGFDEATIFNIAILEIVLALMLLIPQTSFLAAILLTGYLGGATVTHVRIHDSFAFPVVMGVIMWVGLALRRPKIFSLLFGR
jgi:multidrug efflux pump subunit AcrB